MRNERCPSLLDLLCFFVLLLVGTCEMGQIYCVMWCITAYPDATAKGNRNNINGSWNPFSCGPRNCIGQALAMAELRTTLAVMLGNFFFELPEGVEREKFIREEEVWWVTLQPRHGMQLRVRSITEEEKKVKGHRSDFFYQELQRLAKEAEAARTGRKSCLKPASQSKVDVHAF